MPSASRQPSVNAASVDDYRYANQSEPANRFRLNNEQQRRDPYPTQRYRTPHPMASGYRGYDNRDRYPMLVDGYEGFEHHREIRPSPVCYSCGVPGHIARFCDRRRAFREEPVRVSYQANYRPPSASWPTRPPATRVQHIHDPMPPHRSAALVSSETITRRRIFTVGRWDSVQGIEGPDVFVQGSAI
ncbi:hypothetical protein HPB50_026554 [Hyalomma asiaticum]|uniref:Uncharacterized protein n=1 Tax=Hyalomma asiaticum TaxID=266040 RepID=A0ACB7TP89_HYAAI|nr:hypothetical protein HPB50_026554 [Hyalomma asiaticum]